MAGFQVVVSHETRFVVVRPRGGLDRVTSPRLALVLASLLGDGCSSVVLDLADLTFLDRDRCWLIGEASRLFQDHGGEFAVRGPPVAVRKVLDAAGLTSLVDNAETTARMT